MKRTLSIEIAGCHECTLVSKLSFNSGIFLDFCDNSLLIGKGKFSVFREIEEKVFHQNCPLKLI